MFAGIIVVVVLVILALLSKDDSGVIGNIAFGLFKLIYIIGAGAFILAICMGVFGSLGLLWEHFFK